MFISPEDQCNAFLDAVFVCISVNDCHFNLKALSGIYDRSLYMASYNRAHKRRIAFVFTLEWP